MTSYIGRFAPSPTGELHQGSLLTAVASYLDARSQDGTWLVRMEDLDPPREQPGAADAILLSLDRHGLHWDGEVMYQSKRSPAYDEALELLRARNLTYCCDCTRQRLRGLRAYDGHCRRHPPSQDRPCAIRLQIPDKNSATITYNDLFQGPQEQDLTEEPGDFVIHRKDGLYAYQLAVVVDDIDQGITHVIRGLDLLDSSPRQRYLFEVLNRKPSCTPEMGHLPIIVNPQGQKLSKQTYAPVLDATRANENLWQALCDLNHQPPAALRGATCSELLSWGREHWSRQRVPRCASLPAVTTTT
ncbi:tRNA glutamyl-Q(34) synthetase GluQRS [Pseudomaricurvus alkylphenolicus]|uniref:tRNA glutamyl-Q(34) synthetase GluQRS n=1 Tax=Pseudomaricurvus alkylphenolicus TaxID=1306991 RepID=UPI00141DF9E6|nr:tRNA glutamyl-Q(34) synthetase GluQRS [Pseudomaricurvus alkylphenolicus]NIB42903.1 tRNA glutamyl-Q(34) synthetase GluQRS [Pseudomaricurvus alkylphenolicus]